MLWEAETLGANHWEQSGAGRSRRARQRSPRSGGIRPRRSEPPRPAMSDEALRGQDPVRKKKRTHDMKICGHIDMSEKAH